MLDQNIIDLIIEAEKAKKKIRERDNRIPLTVYDDMVWEDSPDDEEKTPRGVVVIDI